MDQEVITEGAGDRSVSGRDRGNDTLQGGPDVDSIDGGSGDDQCESESGSSNCELELPSGEPARTVYTRVYDGDGLLTQVAVTHPDGTVDVYGLTWDKTLPVPQLVSYTLNGVSTSVVYGMNRALSVDAAGIASGFEYSVLGDVTGGFASVSTGFDPYGAPDSGNSTVDVGFGYRGELHVGEMVYLRFRDLDPVLGRFTTIDPLDGVPGTTTVANQYAYAGNDPIGAIDPWGLRPTDLEILEFVDYTDGFAGFEHLGALEVAGFIQEEVSELNVSLLATTLGPVPLSIRLYLGDNRFFSDGQIPADRSRFFARIDFARGRGYVQVNETISADGQVFPAWPIVFNAAGADVPNVLFNQNTSYFSLGRSLDGSAIRLSWSVVHGDRRVFAGPGFTEMQRPSFDGALTVRKLSDESLHVTYRGDCFPSVEAQLLPPSGDRLSVMRFQDRGPEYGLAIYPNCTETWTGQLP